MIHMMMSSVSLLDVKNWQFADRQSHKQAVTAVILHPAERENYMKTRVTWESPSVGKPSSSYHYLFGWPTCCSGYILANTQRQVSWPPVMALPEEINECSTWGSNESRISHKIKDAFTMNLAPTSWPLRCHATRLSHRVRFYVEKFKQCEFCL